VSSIQKLNTDRYFFGLKDEGSETSFVSQPLLKDYYYIKSLKTFVALKDEGSETSFVDQSIILEDYNIQIQKLKHTTTNWVYRYFLV
jgi:hypothetical protein